MIIWYILAFLYFIAVDALIFFQQWNGLIIAIIAGAIFAFIIGVTKALIAPASSKTEPQPPQQAVQPEQQIYVPFAPSATTTVQTPIVESEKQGSFSIALAFFYFELLIIVGLIVYLFIKN